MGNRRLSEMIHTLQTEVRNESLSINNQAQYSRKMMIEINGILKGTLMQIWKSPYMIGSI